MRTQDINTHGWTFVLDRIEARSTTGAVYGWFIYFQLVTHKTDEGEVEELNTFYLTDKKNPIRLEVPTVLLAEEGVINYELGTKDVYHLLTELFSAEYQDVPKPRVSVPLHLVPPAKRPMILELIEKGVL